jgi:hypothetical protein
MKSLSLFLLLSLFSSVSAKPEPRRSRKLIPVRHIAQKACRGDLYEAHALTDKVDFTVLVGRGVRKRYCCLFLIPHSSFLFVCRRVKMREQFISVQHYS